MQPANPTLASNGAETTGDIDYSARPLRTPLARLSGNAGDNSSSQGTGWSTREFGGTYRKDKTGLYSRQYSFGREDSPYPSSFDRDDRSFPQPKAEKPYYNRAEQRTIVAQNLSDRTTHKDIVNILRGGAVLDIFLRSNERSASISFVEGSAAQEFMSYVKRNDIYILGKRVSSSKIYTGVRLYGAKIDFAWNDRQFLLPGHVANKISIGATRNLIIRGVHANITEERLREDLDHIHNLVIIKISYNNGDAHLSLNSVHNALFARTCMMSRAMYKGMKIEWYSDECALPLPRQQWTPRKENTAKPVKSSNTAVNRFQMLNMDGTEDNSNGGNDEDEDSGTMLTEGLSSLKLNHRSPWNPTVAV